MIETAKNWDALWLDAHVATMQPETGVAYGAVKNAALGIRDGRVCWLGPRGELPGDAPDDARVHSAGGRWITPGLIDCHTHLVYGGDRAQEFEMRLHGASYEEIASQGGGILSTVRATRAASENELFNTALPRLRALTSEGVTTIEIKSGYGLDLETELRMLRVARRLNDSEPVDVLATFLGAHALPPEFNGRADEYIEFICETVMPTVAEQKLADAVDAFCEGIGFSPQQVRRIFETAKSFSLPVKLHAEQLSDLNGAALAASYGALSADHLEYVSEPAVEEMSAHGTVAVLLPGAFYFLRESRVPPVDCFRKHGVPMAIATDCNPGSSPVTSLLLMLNMACTLFRMTPEETLAGVTRHAARALGLGSSAGTLSPGAPADFAVWNIGHPAELAYHVGYNPCHGVVKAGRKIRGF